MVTRVVTVNDVLDGHVGSGVFRPGLSQWLSAKLAGPWSGGQFLDPASGVPDPVSGDLGDADIPGAAATSGARWCPASSLPALEETPGVEAQCRKPL